MRFTFDALPDIPPRFPLGKGSGDKIDLVLSRVIPAKAGIQCFQSIRKLLDPGACPGFDRGFTGVTAETQFFLSVRGMGGNFCDGMAIN
ncbi:MAG: hypothetical protein AMJ94_14335 [Deltaproteobacteria bacterium SM23_61]|nr:MAG: hypothetical protein AMJ94_14335 [Deltaproteobacteria bacterium SM23_61]